MGTEVLVTPITSAMSCHHSIYNWN